MVFVRPRQILSRCLNPLDNSVGILISLPLNLLLDVFWIICGKTIWLKLEIIIEFGQVLDEIVYGL